MEIDRYLTRSRSNEHIRSVETNAKTAAMTIIEIRPFRNGWQPYEAFRCAAGALESRGCNQLYKGPRVLSVR